MFIPGRIINITPTKLIMIAIHVEREIFSFKIMYENTKTNTGDKDPIVWASAKAKYRKDKTKKQDSSVDKIHLVIWIL